MKETDSLVILWVSGDYEVAQKMVFMYAVNSVLQHWWQEVVVIVWGPSAKLLSTNRELQEGVSRLLEHGVKLQACLSCADQYGVSDKLGHLGIDVKYMGEYLTNYMKAGYRVLSV